MEGDASGDESCRVAQHIVEVIFRQGSCKGKRDGMREIVERKKEEVLEQADEQVGCSHITITV